MAPLQARRPGRARRSDHPSPGVFSSARRLALPAGALSDPGGVAGYPIDMRAKALDPAWPPAWLLPRERQMHVATAQWGLGCHERWLAGEGERWLDGALGAGRHLMDLQEPGGGWPHLRPFRHTWPVPAPWLSAMAQGQGASLLVRVHLCTGEEEPADAARRALEPLRVAIDAGGVRGELGGRALPQEYPTRPCSHVLNGAIFALWGVRDVAVGLRDPEAAGEFAAGARALAEGVHRWDTGWWSLYSLYPHPVRNVASSFYHALHISQLRAMHALVPLPELLAAARRFERYARSPALRAHAFARKAAFRLVVPRNRLLARRLPWTR